MPYGAAPIVRQALARATPRQRALVLVAMVAGGAAMVALGSVAGALFAGAGLLLLWCTARSRLHRRGALRRRGARAAESEEERWTADGEEERR
jgi:hypothetical protein